MLSGMGLRKDPSCWGGAGAGEPRGSVTGPRNDRGLNQGSGGEAGEGSGLRVGGSEEAEGAGGRFGGR